MKDMMNRCKCPECGYEADEMEFRDRPMKGAMKRDGGLSVYLIGEKEDGGASEEENA
jgi:hypothetical protein